MQAAHIPELKSEKLPVERIYQAAKTKNPEIITAILSQACVDVQYAGGGTPVSRLAAEGDIEAVNFLRIKFKASLLWIASGYALGGHVDEAKSVLALASNPAERLALLQYMAYGYALGRHVDEAKSVLALASNPAERLALLQWIVYGYAQGGQVDEAKSLLALVSNPAERLPLIKKIVSALKANGIFSNSESTLLTLALFDPDSQKEVANELKESKSEMKADVMALVPKATLLHPLITTKSTLTRPINFRYRLGIAWPGIQEWLLMTGIHLVNKGKLNNHTLLTITTFLVPISYSESMDLSNKMFTTYRTELFYSNLLKHNRLLTTDMSIVPAKEKNKLSIAKR
jgi:hypothetical protein